MIFQTPQNVPSADQAYNNATALFQAGQLAEAEKGYKNLLKIWKDHPQTHHALGKLLSQTGQQKEALEHLSKANDLMPNNAFILNDTAIAYLHLNEMDKAQSFLKQTLSINPNLDIAINALGVVYMRQGILDKAKTQFETVLKKHPNSADALENMAHILIQSDQTSSEALRYFQKACRARPDDMGLLSRFGVALIQVMKFEEAEKIFKTVIQKTPRDVIAYTHLANAQVNIRNHKDAANTFAKAMEIAPDNEFLVYNLLLFLERTYEQGQALDLIDKASSNIKNENILALLQAFKARKSEDFEKAIELLEKPELELALNIDRHFLLGKLYQKTKNYDAAFAAFTTANDLQKGDTTYKATDKSLYPKLVEHITEHLNESLVQPHKQEAEKTPLFLVGFPRSGTTLTGQILHSHPDIFVADEVMAADQMRRAIADYDLDYPSGLKDLNEKQIVELQDIYWAYQKNSPLYEDTPIFIDKFPLNSVHASLIARTFPKAKMIYIHRHPYDCVLSCFMQHFRLNVAMIQFTELKRAATLYDLIRHNWKKQEGYLPLDVHHLKYEELTADFENQAKALIEFADVPWNDAVLKFHETAEDTVRTSTPSYDQINKPIYASATHRWEKYKDHIDPIIDILKPHAEELGYKT